MFRKYFLVIYLFRIIAIACAYLIYYVCCDVLCIYIYRYVVNKDEHNDIQTAMIHRCVRQISAGSWTGAVSTI